MIQGSPKTLTGTRKMSFTLFRHTACTLPSRRLRVFRTTAAAAMPLIHWDSKTCPYAQRSWITLIEKKLPFEIKQVDLQNKSSEFISTYQKINPDPTAPAKVPILQDGDVELYESNIICEYLASKYAGQGEQLLPTDPVSAAKVRLFIETFGTQFTGNVFGLLRVDNQEALGEARDKLVHGLKVLNAFLERHGSPGGHYFLGSQYSLAETGTTSFVQRALATLPHYRGVDLWQVVREEKLDRLEQWLQAALARPSAVETKPDDEVIVQGWAKFVVPVKN